MSKTLIASIIGLVLVIAAAVLIILNGKSEYDKALERKGTLIAQRDQLEAQNIEALENEYYAAQTRYNSVKAADEGTFNHNENWNDILSYLETESVSDITITSVTSNPSDLTLNVAVSSKEEAAKLLLQYQSIPYFSKVTINSITETSDEEANIKVVTFSLRCDYQKLKEDSGKEE